MVLWKSSYLKKTQILKCNYEIIFFPKYVCCFIKNVKVIPEDLSLYTYRYIDCLYSVITVSSLNFLTPIVTYKLIPPLSIVFCNFIKYVNS